MTMGSVNTGSYIYGGVLPKGKWQQAERENLKQWWDMADAPSLLQTVDWLLQEGHRAEYQQRGEQGDIAAWDYSRALSLLSSGYVCGYLSRKDALNRSLEIARQVQKMYSSWDNFQAAYFKGYEYWADDSSSKRQQVYRALKSKPNSLYNLPWDLALQRVW